MKRLGLNGKRYRLKDLHRLIDSVARKELGMSGEEAIRIINDENWENRKHYTTWSWLEGLVCLLSEKYNGNDSINANI